MGNANACVMLMHGQTDRQPDSHSLKELCEKMGKDKGATNVVPVGRSGQTSKTVFWAVCLKQ